MIYNTVEPETVTQGKAKSGRYLQVTVIAGILGHC